MTPDGRPSVPRREGREALARLDRSRLPPPSGSAAGGSLHGAPEEGAGGAAVAGDAGPAEALATRVLRVELVLDERTLQSVGRAVVAACEAALSLASARSGALAGDERSGRPNDREWRQSAESPRPGEPLVVGDLQIDFGTREVRRRGQRVALRPKEFELLRALIRGNGFAVPREQLLREVWGYSVGVRTRTLDTHVNALRRKLEDDPAAPRYVLTVRSVGFRFAPQPNETSRRSRDAHAGARS